MKTAKKEIPFIDNNAHSMDKGDRNTFYVSEKKNAYNYVPLCCSTVLLRDASDLGSFINVNCSMFHCCLRNTNKENLKCFQSIIGDHPSFAFLFMFDFYVL